MILVQFFSLQFSLDEPFYLAAGTQGDKPVVVNTRNFPAVERAYGGYTLKKNAEPVVLNFADLTFNNTAPVTTRSQTLHAGHNKTKKGKGKGKAKGKGKRR